MPGIGPAAELCDSKSGRWLRLSTNAPGLQVYSGNFLDGVPGKGGVHHKARQSICLESQTFPNSTKQPLFPSPWVSPGQTYRHVMVYEFGCMASE
jgi:aldose 1-epimerase